MVTKTLVPESMQTDTVQAALLPAGSHVFVDHFDNPRSGFKLRRIPPKLATCSIARGFHPFYLATLVADTRKDLALRSRVNTFT